jgi:hypothetical protein
LDTLRIFFIARSNGVVMVSPLFHSRRGGA